MDLTLLPTIVAGVDRVLSGLSVTGPVLNFWNLSKAQLPALAGDAETIYKEVTGLISNIMNMVHTAQVPTQADWDKAIAVTNEFAKRLKNEVRPVPPGA